MAPGKSMSCGLGYTNELYLELCGIDTFAQIGFVLGAYDPETGEQLLLTPELTVDLPAGEGYAQAYDDSGTVVYDEGGIRVVVKDKAENGWGGYEIPVFVENLSDKDIIVTPASITVDGTALDEDALYQMADVPAGKRALTSPWIDDLNEDSSVQVAFRISEFDLATYEELDEVGTTDVITVN